MLKVKLINEKTPLKIKMVAKFPSVVLANLQDKETTPTKESQVVVADKNYDGLSKVIVNPIPDEYIIPTGELEIIQNGTYDISSKASAKVNVPMPTGTIDITENGLHNVKDKEFANVNVPEKQLGTKTITSNGTYKASDDGLDGYSEVNVSTSGVDINDYYDLTKRTSGDFKTYIKQIPMIDTSDYTNISSMFQDYKSLTTIPQLDTSKVTNMNYMFSRCMALTTIPQLDTSNVTDMKYTFYSCQSLTTIPQLDTSNVTDMYYMFNNCKSLITIPQLDTSNVTNISNIVYSCPSLTTLGGFTNLGQAYDTSKSANNYNYGLYLNYSTNLTHDSLMNVINNLYDIATKGCKPQQLVLGSTNLAKLTVEEIQVAQLKGWSLS